MFFQGGIVSRDWFSDTLRGANYTIVSSFQIRKTFTSQYNPQHDLKKSGVCSFTNLFLFFIKSQVVDAAN